jgi:hypothetical protein
MPAGIIRVIDVGVTAVTWGAATTISVPVQLKLTPTADKSVPKFVPVSVIVLPLTVIAVRVGKGAGAPAGRAATWFLASADTKTMPKKGGLTIPATNPSVAAVPLGTPRFSAIARPIKKPNMLNLMFVSILVLDLLLA